MNLLINTLKAKLEAYGFDPIVKVDGDNIVLQYDTHYQLVPLSAFDSRGTDVFEGVVGMEFDLIEGVY